MSTAQLSTFKLPRRIPFPPAFSRSRRRIEGENLVLEVSGDSLPLILLVPEGSSLSLRLHRQVLCTFLFGVSKFISASGRVFRKELPPLLVEASSLEQVPRLRKKQEFAAYLWRRILNHVEVGLEQRDFRGVSKDFFIYQKLLAGISHLQAALALLENYPNSAKI